MWKIACSGAWCVLVCLVAVYAGFQWAPAPKQVETQSPGLTEHEVVKSAMVTVPIIRERKVDGYVVAEVTLTANDEALRASPSPEAELTDELIATLLSGPVLTDPEFAADALRLDLVARMNKRIGLQAYYKTLITKLDYLTAADLERMRTSGANPMKVTPWLINLCSMLCLVPCPKMSRWLGGRSV